MRTFGRLLFLLACTLPLAPTVSASQSASLASEIDKLTTAVEPELIQWRRHLHQNPELSNREVETAKYVVERLRSFGLEPQTGVAQERRRRAAAWRTARARSWRFARTWTGCRSARK